jgi:broad specificity phosphatase PhoE
MSEVLLVRHGQTQWSRDGLHTSTTDLPLLDEGRAAARALRPRLAGHAGGLVVSSPLTRAVQTAQEAGLGDGLETWDELMEWDYGAYEGLTTPQIREERPGWDLWRDGCPDGETAAEVGARADRAIARVREVGGDAIIFAHGHLLRVLAARWVGLGPEGGALLALTPASVSELGYERERPVVRLWNSVTTS